MLSRLKAGIERRFPYREVTSEADLKAGLRVMVEDGLASQAMATLTTGPFLVAFALSVGANNVAVGLLAALPFLTQFFQLPAVLLVETVRRRRAICIVGEALSRASLFVMVAAAFVSRSDLAVGLLVGGLFLHTGFGAFAGCSWNSWMRDFVPGNRLGAFFAKRLLMAGALSALLSFSGGALVDVWPRLVTLDTRFAYVVLIVIGFAFGMVGVVRLNKLPEPSMDPASRASLTSRLRRPLSDPNFRRLIAFLGTWNFAVNLAAPFFTVFMLTALHLDMITIMTMSVVSLVPNVLLSQLWGRTIDRFSNKAVLAICGPMFILAIFTWTFIMFPEKHRYSMHLLVAAHFLMGIATAGVTLAAGNIGLKLAPKGEATAYLAVLSLVNALAAGAAPIIGGLCADFFAQRELALVVEWLSPQASGVVPILIVRHWGFYFVLASLIGLFSLTRLRHVREEGEASERAVLSELILDARRSVNNLSTVNGLLALTAFPVVFLRRKRRNLEDAARAYLIPKVEP
ncbi:MAG: MFS transporter [Rhodospirillales bacterium]|nr:MFS transporter [Rhodospirillales bacterium]